jgi:FtsH-binding integral membrane protein
MDTVLEISDYRSASEVNSAMGRVYGYMALALVASIFAALGVASVPALMTFLFTGWMQYVTILLPLPLIFLLGVAMNANPPRELALLMLVGFATVMGVSLTALLARDVGVSVQAFLGGAVLFGTMSGYGYFTKQSLEGWGRFLFMAVIAILLVSVVNLFLGSSLLGMIVSAVAVLVFSALTAYDTQQIRERVQLSDSTAADEVMGSLSLYMNFINIWISLINLLGGNSRD